MIAIEMEVVKLRERRSGMSWASWRPGRRSFKGDSFNSEPGAKMRENKTRLLLILSQDMLDQARVIAGRATTVLKLPVSLQIVFRALIGVGLKRESHAALLASIERQARAVRQQRRRAGRAGEGRKLASGHQ
jgi:hypothetical protein